MLWPRVALAALAGLLAALPLTWATLALERVIVGSDAGAEALPEEQRVPPWKVPPRALALHGSLLVCGSVLLGALLFRSNWETWTQGLALFYVLYVLAAVDVRTLKVETGLVLLALLARLAWVVAAHRDQAAAALLGALAGAGLISLSGLVYQRLRGRQGMGEGDAALLALIGAFVGWQGILPALLVAAATGLVVGLAVLLALRKPLSTPLPFAPFLCVGGLAAYVAQQWAGTGLGGWPG